MLLLIINLKTEKLIHKIVDVMLEMEMTEASVIDSEAIENLAVQTNPLFSEIGMLFGQNLAYQRMLFTTLPDRETLDTLVRMCLHDGVNLEDPEVASMWVLPCETYKPGNAAGTDIPGEA